MEVKLTTKNGNIMGMNLLGIDVGGSGIKGAIVDTDTGLLTTERYRIETPQPATPKVISEKINEIIQHFEWQNSFGIGFPAAIQNDIVSTASNIHNKWLGLNAPEYFFKKTGCAAKVINDADAAGIAEMRFGAGLDTTGLILLLTVGTGIGSVIFRGDTLVPNTELGHIYMPNGKIAEDYASDAVRQKKNLSWHQWGKRFNKYLKYMENLFWPDYIIIGGGISKKFDLFATELSTRTPIVPAKLLNHAGIIGAALAARKEKFSDSKN